MTPDGQFFDDPAPSPATAAVDTGGHDNITTIVIAVGA